jgi:hypothetical protein
MHNGEDGPSATPARYGYCSVPACLMLHVSPFRSEDAMSLQPDQRGAVVCRTENGLCRVKPGCWNAVSHQQSTTGPAWRATYIPPRQPGYRTVEVVRVLNALNNQTRRLHARAELGSYCTCDLPLTLGHRNTVAQKTARRERVAWR